MLKQKEDELAQAKERFQRDLDQSKAEQQAHLQSLETKINEVEANHETQNQKSQRELALRTQELAAKNAILEEEMLLKQQSQEEKEVARCILFSQTADSAIDVDAYEADQLLNASTQREEPAQTGTHQDWNPTPREGAASQSSQQTEPPSQSVNSAAATKTLQENSSPHSATKTGKRVRNAPQTKIPAVKEREKQLLTDVASVAPPGSAK